jgi:hypothetical protein
MSQSKLREYPSDPSAFEVRIYRPVIVFDIKCFPIDGCICVQIRILNQIGSERNGAYLSHTAFCSLVGIFAENTPRGC